MYMVFAASLLAAFLVSGRTGLPVDCNNGYWSRSPGSSIPSRDSVVIADVDCMGWAPMRAYVYRSDANYDLCVDGR